MATKRTVNMLPAVFQTDSNKKFLNATLDQLLTEPKLNRINGYIGRKFSPTYKNGDSYITESTNDRTNYQLEPSVIVKNKDTGEVEFHATYAETLQKLNFYGASTVDQSDLWSNEYYSFNPRTDADKFINFGQYYWLPDGPDVVDVYAGSIDLENDFVVAIDSENNVYNFSETFQTGNPDIVLARGGTYNFIVNQPGHKFWIQSSPGVAGTVVNKDNISARDVLGVINNGAETGSVTFAVPTKGAQDFYINLPSPDNFEEVDFATTSKYTEIHNQLLSRIINNGGIDGQTTGLNGKHLVFATRYYSDSDWEAGGLLDFVEYDKGVYDEGGVVLESKRYGIWQIVTTPTADDDMVVTLQYITDLPINNKVTVKSGLVYGSTEWYKNAIGEIVQIPLLTANLDVLYYQDSENPDLVGVIRIVEPSNNTIDVDADILSKPNYISPNGVVFTNGLKIKFDSSAIPTSYSRTDFETYSSWYLAATNFGATSFTETDTTTVAYKDSAVVGLWDGVSGYLYNKEYYVEGVGKQIKLVLVSDLDTSDNEMSIDQPDYTAINRSSRDVNPWSRHNRWFHKEVIRLSAQYNNTVPVYDQEMLAKRPIIEFEPDLQLYNFGYNKKSPVDIFDTTVTNPFITVEGVSSLYLDSTLLTDGMRIIFAADADSRTRNKIWVVNFVDLVDADDTNNNNRIVLTLAADGTASEGDTVFVKYGASNSGKSFWYDGNEWVEGQHKTSLHQAPLFDVFDRLGYSFANTTKYPTTGAGGFTGNKIFSYGIGTGAKDTVLGFSLSYKNFNQVGDIKFVNNFDSEEFSYVVDNITSSAKVNTGFIKKWNADSTFSYVNTWSKVERNSLQYQNLSYIFDGITNSFYVDIQPKTESDIPNLIVYANSKKLSKRQWRKINSPSGGFKIYVATNYINKGDRIDIFVNSDSQSNLGFYQVPPNLDLNAQNQSFTELTLGAMRNHYSAQVSNDLDFSGKFPGVSNLRDIPIESNIGTIFQHSAPATYASLFLNNEETNFIDATNFASQEYTRFKNKFLEFAVNDATLNYRDIPGVVDSILKRINAVKNKSFPWYYSDMVPFNDQQTTITYNIFNPNVKRYEITEIFNDTVLSNRAILVYLNGIQLIKGQDYSFDPETPALQISSTVTLAVNDSLKIVEYSNTDGCWVPETPTKLGLYPKFTPAIYTDYSYITPVEVLRGHDGSITPTFGDFRDSILLELEKRIYNNIKVPYDSSDFDIYDVVPGKFRDNGVSLINFNKAISSSFMKWVGDNRLDYTTNDSFTLNNSLTWNYRQSPDIIDGENLPGTWRACFQYFYDTQYPDLRPWEMLGFSEKPSWWETYYGPAPYTSGNKILWTDLQNGYIAAGERQGTDPKFARPGLLNFIPVTDSGELISPTGLLSVKVNPLKTQLSFTVGNYGPVEHAWRNSSDYPYAMQIAMALTKPGKYFGLNINKQKYSYDSTLNQYLVADTSQRIVPSDVVIHGTVNVDNSVERSCGYLNWIGDYLKNFGVDPTVKLAHYVQDYTVQLSYRMAGFSDKKYLKVYAEQHSPNSVNDSIIIPDSDYDLILNKSTPLQKIIYSAVIVEKSAGGFKVSGYNTSSPYFTVIPPETTGKYYDLSVLDETVSIYSGYKAFKVSIPYGYEFADVQQVTNFLIGYGLALTAAGFKFDGFDQQLGEIRNWTLAAKEFLFWSKQRWAEGNVIVLSPVGSELTLNTGAKLAIVDKITNSVFGSRVVNQNFQTLTPEFYTVNRVGNSFTVKTVNGDAITLADLNLVQYEHALIFNNTTMFADTIYQPELGSRQFRLKLAGFKTGQWTGNLDPQGFIYNSSTVQEWQPLKDYLKGDLIQYKAVYYVANENISGSADFSFAKWKQIDKNQIKTGLLNNFATNSKISEQFYDVDGVNLESQYDLFGKGLIGYRNRGYLNDLDLDDTSQVKFYQGYIKDKGTLNSLSALTSLASNNIASDISFKEEWAFRVGEYGALETSQFVEVDVSNNTVHANPFSIQLMNSSGTDSLADLSVTAPYKYSAQTYNKNIFVERTSNSKYTTDLETAGFVHLDDADYAIFDLANYSDLNNSIDSIGSGKTIWCAKGFDSLWNVYRVSETQVHVTDISTGLDNTLVMKTNNPHGLSIDNVVLVKSADQFTGFYKIVSVPSLTTFTVAYSESLTGFQGVTELSSQLLYLHSVKFNYASDIADFTPRDGWRTNETAWVLNATTSQWGVYSKSEPWTSTTSLTAGETVADGNYGASVVIGKNNNFAAIGQPGKDTGRVISYVLGFNNQLTEDSVIQPTAEDSLEFGSVMAQGLDYTVVGAPGSLSDQGYVYILKRLANSNLVTWQVLTAADGSAGDRFGEAVAISDDDQWMYVSSPEADKVYVYRFKHDTSELVYNLEANGTDDTFTLGFEPESIDSFVVIGGDRTYVPYIDYTISGNEITFTSTPAAGTYAIQQYNGYRYVTTIEGSTGTKFGASLATTTEGAQVVIGAPQAEVNSLASAGAVYIYDRTIESSISTGSETLFTTVRPIIDSSTVYVNGVLQDRSSYGDSTPTYELTTSSNVIRFFETLTAGSIVTIETNEFNLLQELTASSPATNSQFGTSLDICPNNCSVYIGAPYDDSEQYNIGAVYRFVNQNKVYGTILGTVETPTVNSGDSIRINNFEVQFIDTSLDSVVETINSSNIPGVVAANEGGYLRINSDSTVVADKLRILPGVGSSLADLGLTVFPQVQKILHPLAKADELFGQKVRIDDTAKVLLVGSTVATTYEKTFFDDGDTTVDSTTDNFVDPTLRAGAIYILNYLGDARNDITHAGKFIYNQQLDPETTLTSNGRFGSDFMLKDRQILVGASHDGLIAEGGGRAYLFENNTGLTGWDQVRLQENRVDTGSILKFYLYNNINNSIIDALDYIDPVKGKILGLADQEITYKASYDPAHYNNGTDTASLIVDAEAHWTTQQVGQVWWDLSTVRWLDYEQDSIIYRTANWGSVFPGSSIDVYEWVESSVLPSRYVESGGDGVPKYADDTAYVTLETVDTYTNATTTKYYFWVSEKTSIDTKNRRLPLTNIKALIENPKGQDVKFAAAISQDSVALFNCDEDLSDNGTVLHIDYTSIPDDSGTIHTEWSLLGENTSDIYALPTKIYNKIVDSLAGSDKAGNPVPDPLLPVQQRYGVGIRPRQGVFVNKNNAVKIAIEKINTIFKSMLMRQTADISGLYNEEPIPAAGSGAYDLVVSNYETLGYVNIIVQPVGYKVLVENNINAGGLWTIYTKTSNNSWFLSRVQSYKVSEYWDFVNWFVDGFDESTVPTYVVDTQADLATLSLKTRDIVKIKNDGTGNWKLVQIFPLGVATVGVQNGTIQFNDSLFSESAFGYDNDSFDTIRFDQNPSLEIRSLIDTVFNTIFVNELSSETINLIFALVNYVLNEQKYVDWVFKTSFVSVLHKLRRLTQPAVFIKDNQDYYLQYIEEVKPYHTTVREYVLDYQGVDNVNGYVTDFDVPSYYDSVFNTYRSPSGEYPQDTTALQNTVYNDWKNHYSYYVDEIVVADGGTGYTIAPLVSITGSYTNNNATARAVVSGGRVTQIILDNPGSDYTTTPVVTITGGNGTGARGYARLTNGLVRGIKTTVAFDRLTYSTTVKTWAANTSYSAGDIISFNNTAYSATIAFTSGSTFDGNNLETYKFITGGSREWSANTVYVENELVSYSGNTYVVTTDFTSNSSFDANNLTSYSTVVSNDRIQAYYVPTANQPGLDFAQLQSGIDYPGVQVLGPLFSYNPAFDSGTFDYAAFDSFEIGPDGTIQLSQTVLDTVISSNYTDLTLGTRPQDINIDGGAYVDTFSSHAPEELIPGIVFDTMDLQVYQTITADLSKEYQGATIEFISHEIVDSNRTFAFKSTNFNNALFVYSYKSGSLSKDIDYTINYFDKTITISKVLSLGDVVFIYSFNYVGENKISDIVYEADGNTTTFSTSIPYNQIGDNLVIVDGVREFDYTLELADVSAGTGTITINSNSATISGTGTLFTTQLAVGSKIFTTSGNIIGKVGDIITANTATFAANSLISANNISFVYGTGVGTGEIVFANAPVAGSHVHIINYGNESAEQTFSEIYTQRETVTSLAPVYPDDYTISLDREIINTLPRDAHMIVAVNSNRLRPATNAYYTADGNQTIFDGPDTAADINSEGIVSSEVDVYLNNELLTETTDYTLPIGTVDGANLTVTFTSIPAADSKICISVKKFAEYTVTSSNTIVIADTVALETGDVVEITSFATHDTLGINTTTYVGKQSTTSTVAVGYSSVSFDSIGFDSDTSVTLALPQFEINESIVNPNYAWITLNGKRLIPNFDFVTQGNIVKLEDNYPLLPTDVLVVTTFTSDTLPSTIGFRVFKDMTDSTHYLRISNAASTYLAEDLSVTDDEIVVEDASVLSSANPTTADPGVIFINGERITYYQIDLNTNTLSQLLRGTAGTSVASHSAGTRVVSGGADQRIPASDDVISATVIKPIDGTISSNVSSNTVTGTSTTFSSNLSVGDYLYNNNGTLIGQVAEINSNTNVILSGNALITSTSDHIMYSETAPITSTTTDAVLVYVGGTLLHSSQFSANLVSLTNNESEIMSNLASISTDVAARYNEHIVIAVKKGQLWYNSVPNVSAATGTGLTSSTTRQAKFLNASASFLP